MEVKKEKLLNLIIMIDIIEFASKSNDALSSDLIMDIITSNFAIEFLGPNKPHSAKTAWLLLLALAEILRRFVLLLLLHFPKLQRFYNTFKLH